MRRADGSRVPGWEGGTSAYYRLAHEDEAFQDHVAAQARAAVASGVFDGVMLDWDGYLPIVRKVREAIGPDRLIVVNIHDRLDLGEQYAGLVNGAFLECDPDAVAIRLCSWEGMRRALVAFESQLAEPQVNALEAWGDRDDLQAMRAATTLALTHSDGFALFADPNPLSTSDHLHDWYPFWDADLGTPTGAVRQRPDGAYERAFTRGLAVYNPPGGADVAVAFDAPRRRASTGETGTRFTLAARDGDLFLLP